MSVSICACHDNLMMNFDDDDDDDDVVCVNKAISCREVCVDPRT